MKTPKHVPLLRANDGECEALTNLDGRTRRRILPLFEVGPITESILERRYMQLSPTPTITHINRTLQKVVGAWFGQVAMVDCYQWAADARTETGIHVLTHAARYLRANGVPVVPVVGYDRWENRDYQAGLRSVGGHEGTGFCLRLDSIAIEDSLDPDHFLEVVSDIVETLDLTPRDCCVIIDFGDVSSAATSLDHMIDRTQAIVAMLAEFDFGFYVLAGCSLPGTINQAVADTDAEGIVVRKESLAWKTLREDLGRDIVSGDYGVRGPTTTEVRSQYTNGKIRYTIDSEIFVVRGHAFKNDGNFAQLADLCETLSNSIHYLGPTYSWGDAQVEDCRLGGRTGNLSHWIAIDTNHHLTFVVEEVEEFVRALADAEDETAER